jgi:hypothetical protein
MAETEKVVFKARRREKTGKGVARKLRREKRLPAGGDPNLALPFPPALQDVAWGGRL